eukprot:gene7864-8061_t
MVGWDLPKRVLLIFVISSKLTCLVGLLSLAVASLEIPTPWLTSSNLVQLLLLKAGLGVGVLVSGLKTLDDLARFMDPAGYRKRQRRKQKLSRQNAASTRKKKSE